MTAAAPKHLANRRNSNRNNRQVMNVEIRSPSQKKVVFELIIVKKKPALPEDRREPVSSTECHSRRRREMSTSEIIAAFESGDLDLDVTTSMDLPPLCCMFMDLGRKTMKFRKRKGLVNLSRTMNKTYLDCSTMCQRTYSLETAKADERLGGSR